MKCKTCLIEYKNGLCINCMDNNKCQICGNDNITNALFSKSGGMLSCSGCKSSFNSIISERLGVF